MMPRFITKLEQEYDKKFPDCEEARFYNQTKEGQYFTLLKKAINRGEKIRHEEMVALWGKKAYGLQREYLKQWEYNDF